MYSSPPSSSGAMNFLQDNNDNIKKISSGQKSAGTRPSDHKKKKSRVIKEEDEDEDALPIGKVLIRKGGKPIKRKVPDSNTQIEIESKIDESSLSNDSRVSRVSRFREGDMVWGKVKSHPWWPGQIFNPALATATAKRSRRSGHVLVAFFGDATFGWFVESNLIPFEPTFKEKSKQTVSRSFIEAVEDAIDELYRRAALGLMCNCRNKFKYGSTRDGYVEVLVPGWEQPVVYPDRILKEARNGFRPEQMLDFVKKMAVSPWCGDNRTIAGFKFAGEVKAYRTATAVPVSAKYREDLGILQRKPGSVLEINVVSDQQFRCCEEGTQRKAVAQFSVKDQKGHSNLVDGEGISILEGQAGEKEDSYLFKRRDIVNGKQNSTIKGSLPNGIKKFKIDQGTTLLGDAEETDDVSNYVFKKRSQQEEALAVENKGERKKADQRLHGERHDLPEVKKRKRKNDDHIPHLEVQAVEKKEERDETEQGSPRERHAIQEVKRRKRESIAQISHQEKEAHTVNKKQAEGRKKAKEGSYRGQPNLQEKKERKNETAEPTLHLEKNNSMDKHALKRRISDTEALNDCLSNTNLEISNRVRMKLASNDLHKESLSIQSVQSDALWHEATEKLQKSLPNKKYKRTVQVGADSEGTTQIEQVTPDEAGYVSRKADKSKKESSFKDLVGGKVLGVKSDKSFPKSSSKKKSAKALHVEKKSSGNLLCGKEAAGNILSVETVEAGGEDLTNDKLVHEKQRVDLGSSKPYTVDAERNILNARLQEGHLAKSDHVEVDKSIGLTSANEALADAGNHSFFNSGAHEESEVTANVNIQNLDYSAKLTCNRLQFDACNDFHLDAMHSNDRCKLSLEKKSCFKNLKLPSIAVGPGSDSSVKHLSENLNANLLNLNDVTNGQIGIYEERGTSKVSELNLDFDKRSSWTKENVDISCPASETSTYISSSSLSSETNVVAGTDLVIAGQMDDVVCLSPSFEPTIDHIVVCKPEGFIRPGTSASLGEDRCNDNSQLMPTAVTEHGMNASDKQAVGDVGTNKYDGNHTFHLDGRGESKEDDQGSSDLPLVQDQGHNFYERNVDSQFLLHQLVKDLKSIATGPFHGIKWDCLVDLSRVLLRFRSVVYEKIQDSSYIADTSENVVPSTGIEMEDNKKENEAADRPLMSLLGNVDANGVDASRRSEATVAAVSNLEPVTKLSNNMSQTNEADSQAKESKKKKIVAWSDGHSKSSKKSYSSPEKSSSKMSAKRHSGISGRDSREAVRYKKRSNQPSDSCKTLEEPMGLSMKFPQGFALPSEAQLKARFVRFGQLDISGTRIYCQTNCARVVFKCTSDAEAAYKYAMKNSLFGQANVKFKLKQMIHPTKEAVLMQSGSESQNKGTETLQGNSKVSKERNIREEVPSAVPDVKFDTLEANIQDETPKLPDTETHDLCSLLASDGPMPAEASDDCPLNEPCTSPLIQLKSCLKKPDESGNINIKESIRVTFLLDKEDRPDINDMKSGFSQNESCRDSVPVVGPQNSAVAPEPPDISNQMMYLLKKCNEIVGDIRSSIGYVPYHLFSSST
ncbi:PWWP domain-containing protein 1 isoform X1 [Cryptomeria japonica]|uniref:PWWP domain-containing protein 1 isoform X1 n=2 Tax=Cryptomeria japonica TaxID=3369 RepID=UPI0025AD7138|nr:PWWP domain-containing protein 1 isoform X1 [Cryptomeria japonica]